MKSINEFTREDIALNDKLENMLWSEISDEVQKKCYEEDIFNKIENEIWNLLNEDKRFKVLEYFEGLAREYEPSGMTKEDEGYEHEIWSACLYNCDLIYMIAIAHVLGLREPTSSGDVDIFGIDYD